MAAPRCEVCRCTDRFACEGGCGWSLRFLKVGRRVCTNCEDKAKPLRRGFKLAKKVRRNP